jgi:N-acetylmuramic acid 6-phosphate etherase
MSVIDDLARLTTEAINPASVAIDALDTIDILHCINAEDCSVPPAVGTVLDDVAVVVEAVVRAFQNGGRLLYVGAGTSGRLGIVDASECPPTYGTPPDLVQAIIAGGPEAVFRSQEGAEDRPDDGAAAIAAQEVTEKDVVVGIAASGRTPFVLGALVEAASRLAFTAIVSTNPKPDVLERIPFVDAAICPVVGPEVVAGSTRMKSGTAQKLVLNMITTAAMIRIGKTYGNIMVDLQLTNEKLVARAVRIVEMLGKVSRDEAVQLLRESGDSVKRAIVMARLRCPRSEADERLAAASGRVRLAIGE